MRKLLKRMRDIAYGWLGLSAAGASSAPLRTEKGALGRWGERAAEAWLARERGMRCLARNWRHGKGELDLIMEERGTVVFVEVRTRRGAGPLAAYASIDWRKRRTLRATAKAYLRGLPRPPRSYRFDVVLMDGDDPTGGKAVHYEGVRLFGRHFRP